MLALFVPSTPPNASSSQSMRGPEPAWSYMACSAAMNGCIKVTTFAPPDSRPWSPRSRLRQPPPGRSPDSDRGVRYSRCNSNQRR